MFKKYKRKNILNENKIQLAINFDVQSNEEIAIIGNAEKIKKLISSAKNKNDIASDTEDISVYIRPYGSLVFDIEHQYFPFRDYTFEMFNSVSVGNNKHKEIFEKYMQQIAKDNVSLIYAITKIYNDYQTCDLAKLETLHEFISDDFVPLFTQSNADSLINAFKLNKKKYYNIFPSAYPSYLYPQIPNGEFCTTQNCDMFYIADYNILSILKLYIADCGKNHKFLKRCKNKQCGKLMLGNISNIKEYCSDKCRDEAYSQAIAKRRDKLQNVSYEAAFAKAYQRYYYYLNKKFKAAGLSDEQLFPFIKEFQLLQQQMEVYRKEIQANRITEKEFFIWLNEQTNKVEEECIKLNNFIKGGGSDQK